MGKKGKNKVADIVANATHSSTRASISDEIKAAPIERTIDFTNNDLSNFLKALKEFEEYSNSVNFVVG